MYRSRWGANGCVHCVLGVKTVEKFPCRVFINAELDSISFREAAGSDTTMVWALF